MAVFTFPFVESKGLDPLVLTNGLLAREATGH